MAAALTLQDAAGGSYDNLITKDAAQVIATLDGFVADLLPVFPETDQASHPVANWLTLMASISAQIAPFAVGPARAPFPLLYQAIQYTYRVCWVCTVTGTSTQQTAMLTSYNIHY